MASSFGALASKRVVFAKEMQQRCFLQPHSPIGFALFVNQKWKGDSSLFAESTGIVSIAKPNCGEPCSFVFELLYVLAQLRDVLTAENSTPVAKEHQDCRLVGPKRAELDLFAVNIGQNNAGQLAAVGITHGHTFSVDERRMSR